MVNLPGQVWKLPEGEDDEAAEQGTGRILALSDGVFAIALRHHVGFRLVARYDSTLVWLNLLLLLFVAFLPFPTGVLGHHIGSPAAAVLYAASMVLLSGALAGCWWYASGRDRLLVPNVSGNKVRGVRARTLSAPLLFAATVPIAMAAPYVAEVMWFLTFPAGRMAYVWFSASRREPAAPPPGGL
ncbi:MAG: hypothetical protein ACR2FU_03735 [Streptosporangiaceae bacterium]